MIKIKLLVTDYDNTYELHYSDIDTKKIFLENKKAAELMMTENILAIATGRHFSAMKKTIDDNQIKFDFLCCNNGAEFYNSKLDVLFCQPIDDYDLMEIKRLESLAAVFYRTPYNKIEITSVNIYFEDFDKFNTVKLFLSKNLKYSQAEYKYPKIKILSNKCNKLNFVIFLHQYLKIKTENIYTIGDDINDIDMIKGYHGYSLFTAKKEVQKCALGNYNSLNELVYQKILKK